jgi:ABC-type nitrate/sulfonate/bicarbonate transport system substrate-binding protein
MAESLRSGRIDVGEFPQPFDAIARKQMQVKTVFTSKEGMPFDDALGVIVGHSDYLKAHAAAITGFLGDLQAATRYYIANTVKARQLLIDTKFVRVPADVYLHMEDYYRDPTLRVDVDTLKKMQDAQVAAGFQKKKVDVASLVDLSYLPK